MRAVVLAGAEGSQCSGTLKVFTVLLICCM